MSGTISAAGIRVPPARGFSTHHSQIISPTRLSLHSDDPDAWVSYYDFWGKLSSNVSAQAPVRKALRSVLGYSLKGMRSDVDSTLQVVPLGNAKGDVVGQISFAQYLPQKSPPAPKPTLYYVTGMDHPSVIYEKKHTETSARRQQKVIAIDLPGNGGSYLKVKGGIESEDLLMALVSTIRQTSLDGEAIELNGMSLGAVPVVMLTDLYYNHPEKFKALLGNRTLAAAPLLVAPVLTNELIHLGGLPNRQFMYPLAIGVFTQRKMLWDYRKKRRRDRDLFFSHHSEKDRLRLRPIVTRNQMPSSVFSVMSFPKALNRRPVLEMVRQGQLKIAFHEQDQIFGVKNPEDFRNTKGFYLLPGGHSAGTGEDVPEAYLQAYIEALEDVPQTSPREFNPQKAYRRWRGFKTAGLRLRTDEALVALDFSARYGLKFFKRFGLAFLTGIVPQLGVNWKGEGITGGRVYAGFSNELRRIPLRLDMASSFEARVMWGQEARLEFVPALHAGLNYTALELINDGVSAYVGEKRALNRDLQVSSFYWNLELALGFRF